MSFNDLSDEMIHIILDCFSNQNIELSVISSLISQRCHQLTEAKKFKPRVDRFVAYDQRNLIKWSIDNGFVMNLTTMQLAIRRCHFITIWYLRHRGCPWNERTIAWAAKFRPRIVKRLYERGCPWDKRTCEGLAFSGQLKLLRWVISEGCPTSHMLVANAAEGGHLDIIEWALEMNYSAIGILDHAAIGGQIHILNWAEERGMIGTNRKFVCARAAEGGHLEVLKWARQRDYPWGSTGVIAARKCRIEILKWVMENGCSLHEEVCEEAARFRQFKTLKWLKDNDVPWNERVFEAAAGSYGKNYFKMMKWMKSKGCPWDEETFNTAVKKRKSVKVLEWLYENNCPWSEKTYKLATRSLAIWLEEKGCPN